ncbi:undecaprenyl-diphosphatase UppP [Eubacterium sp. AB3007]|uniref:undecaprenyl-diphosphatase UppP n=1 Tax=Eubacterium sp. AB3007 TaxID=1392487 RepID=UPI0004865951|nr:undecaprenyl-diphosphatase UppP [Eubacterium sp. AB3007]
MTYTNAIILGIVQGLAEFLPISSSGHLALLQHFFHVEADKVLMFTVLLHIGTLLSVFIMYWRDIWELIKEFFITIADLVRGRGLRLQERPVRKLGVMIIVATIPTALMGFLLNDFFESLNSILWAIGIGWIFTGFILYFSEKLGRANRDLKHMNFRNAIFIGIMQGIAICPGVSRSGSTMVGGLVTGFKREFAVKFAFLISIPSILGAAVLEVPEAMKATTEGLAAGPLIVGMIVSAVCGILAIKLMIKVVIAQKLKYFSCYVWVLGALTVGYGLYLQFHP